MQTKGRTWRKRQIKSVKTTSLAHKQEYIALFQWAKQNGVFFHKMKPAIFPGTGRGLMATKQINAGDLLISVPSKLLVTEEVLRNSYFDGINSTKALEFSTIELLCLFLILERSLGKQSFWSAYISMLPLDYNMPAYFKHHELKHTPDFFAEHGWSQVKSIRKCYSSLKKFLLDFNDKTKSIQLTFDDVCWAWNAVNTRCVYMIGKARFKHSPQKDNMSCSLAPLLDLLNHSCNVQVTAGFSETGKCYQILTKTKFKKGDQVFINYGPHSNRKLLIEYGFILPYNCHNSVKVHPTLVYEVVSNHYGDIAKRKFDVITKYCLEDTYYCSPNGLSWSLETALKILSLNDTKLVQKSFHINNLQLSTENEHLVSEFSKEILKSILVKYDKDIARIWLCTDGKDGLSERMQQLVMLLEQEMNTVQSALNTF